jgi:hypothetical protein
MSVNVRQHPRGGWDVDINVLLATGNRHRERRKVSASSCSQDQRSERRSPHSKRLLRVSLTATRGRTAKSRVGSRTLDTITNEQVQRLKLQLHDKSRRRSTTC